MLTEQLHLLRKDLGPKEKQLINADEKVQDIEREYGIALQVTANTHIYTSFTLLNVEPFSFFTLIIIHLLVDIRKARDVTSPRVQATVASKATERYENISVE